ncbi:MAG: alpha/beta hydrolase family esterase [Solirubrobacteraceae bacterium]
MPLRCLLLLMILAAGAAPAVAADSTPDPGTTENGSYSFNGAAFPYILYTPASAPPGRALPLLVMIHGCQTTARQELEVTGFNKLAEREGFAVLYPEADALGRSQPGPLTNCWKFADPTAYFRGTGDSAAIAGMTRAVMKGRAVDDQRVYVVGVSAGGLMASVLASAYSDLYAAVGLVATAGFADGPCFTTGVGIPVEASAALAYAQMRGRERVVPIIGMAGDADQAFPAPCLIKAVEQGLRTSNLALSGRQDGPIALKPAAQHDGQVPGGRSYTVAEFRDPVGCLVAERWIIHGMPHAWPGETNLAGYGDTRAPSGAEATWAFLKRYRRSETARSCAGPRRQR